MVIYISVLTGALITLALLHRRAHQNWEDRLVSMSRTVAELEGRMDALSTATEDVIAAEKRFQDGINGILDYNLAAAMGGAEHGRD